MNKIRNIPLREGQILEKAKRLFSKIQLKETFSKKTQKKHLKALVKCQFQISKLKEKEQITIDPLDLKGVYKIERNKRNRKKNAKIPLSKHTGFKKPEAPTLNSRTIKVVRKPRREPTKWTPVWSGLQVWERD